MTGGIIHKSQLFYGIIISSVCQGFDENSQMIMVDKWVDEWVLLSDV